MQIMIETHEIGFIFIPVEKTQTLSNAQPTKTTPTETNHLKNNISMA